MYIYTHNKYTSTFLNATVNGVFLRVATYSNCIYNYKLYYILASIAQNYNEAHILFFELRLHFNNFSNFRRNIHFH